MPEPLVLLTDVDIAPEQFLEFLKTIGAVIHPDEIYDGRVSQGNQHVWIVLETREQLQRLLEDLEEQDISIIESIKEDLGILPRSSVLLDINAYARSSGFAANIICAFAKQWPCIAYDLVARMYSKDDLQSLCKEGRNFMT